VQAQPAGEKLEKSLIGQVFEENYEWFRRFLKSRFVDLNDYDIEDIIQLTAMKLLYKSENLGGIKNLTSYVYTSLQNGAKDHFKKSNRETLYDDEINQLSNSIEKEVLANELKRVIFKAIDNLDKNQKYVFVETQIKGRSYSQLVAESGIKLGTLLSRKNRAIKKLRSSILEYLNY